jgi:hypothetical protein
MALIIGGVCQYIRHSSVSCYSLLLTLPLIVEVGGYTIRSLAHSNQSSIPIFIVQTILLLVAPALFAASIYMLLGRLVTLTKGNAMSLVRATWLTKIFVGGDIFSFLLQSGGM